MDDGSQRTGTAPSEGRRPRRISRASDLSSAGRAQSLRFAHALGYDPHVQTSNPRVVVLGGPIPDGLRAQLQGNIDLVPESEVESGNWSGILVHAKTESLPAVRRFRNAGGLTPIYGLSEQSVDVTRRIQWIREGADDLLALDTAAAVLARRIRGPSTRPASGDTSTPAGVRIDRYLTALHRYLTTRTELLHLLGETGRQRFLDCHFLRDQVLRAADNDFADVGGSQRRGSERDPLQWGVRLLDRPAEEAAAELQNIGSDGIGLCLHHPLQPGETVRVELDGYSMSAIVTVEVRWQRRSGRERWEIGAFALGLDIVRSASA